ncbi:hypothetical protein Hokovirus_1_246 [Hokovirus HKV1]|uniref:Uncharacterized protein n=1 Tax=Hokovirus HKV1 TaxID=1977638 RepID=A0A1V0SF79_9VIRU|nr:hypothetical protein Hokovirus_1_246 [Hokovirus HKV1]
MFPKFLTNILFGQEQKQRNENIDEWYCMSDYSEYPGKIINLDANRDIKNAQNLTEFCSILLHDKIMNAQDLTEICKNLNS